ncbi:MAG: 6-phosphogluconolactonase [Nanoarchaeota archaeon]|nr:6-phosphogluconolactonase [Nanoarchaeota archaeon]
MVKREVISTIFNQDEKEIYRGAAAIIQGAITDILENKDHVVLAVPGGRSVPNVFRLLKEKDIPWEKVHIFMVDERLVPVDDKESNYRLAKEEFIDYLIKKKKLPKENAHPFILDNSSPDKGIEAYAQELDSLGGMYDVVLLSAGEDGHVGALYPNHHSVEDQSEKFIVMNDSPKPPPDRMTMSRKLLLKAKTALVLFVGESKREALQKFLDEKVSFKQCPAKMIQDITDSYAMTDMRM